MPADAVLPYGPLLFISLVILALLIWKATS